jgi:RHS repeat-associated protein
MTKDANKQITSITYNHLNLPFIITFTNKTIKFTYDAAGNILTLKRNAPAPTNAFALIDDLTYTYTGNQNTKIADATTNNAGFKDGTNTDNDYTYDSNGNMTKDNNKQITSITYNHLNLPFVITFTGNRTITFVYDATGKKLMQRIATNAVTDNTATRQYINGIEYNGVNAMQHIATAEGRFLPSTSKYEYSLKDHLGNTRITLTDTDGNGILAAAEVTQSNMYYAFGLEFAAGTTTPTANKYKFNGIEQVKDFDWNVSMAFYRSYDAATGRWGQIDPKPDMTMSGYVGMGNNPVRYSDMLGDTVRYENAAMEKWVKSYTQETTNKKGKEVRNKQYNADFAAKVKTLDASTVVFNYTDNAKLLSDPSSLGEVVHDGVNANQVNIVINGGAKNTDIDKFGGLDGVLFEETFHGVQILTGDVWFEKAGATWQTHGVDIHDEYDAKMFALKNRNISLTYKHSILVDYEVQTQLGYLKNHTDVESKMFLSQGTTLSAAYQGTNSGMYSKSVPVGAAYPNTPMQQSSSAISLQTLTHLSFQK